LSNTPAWLTALSEHLTIAGELRQLRILLHADKCKGVWQCYEVCPIGCWTPDRTRRMVIFDHPEKCIACGACTLQCPENAIELSVPKKRPSQQR